MKFPVHCFGKHKDFVLPLFDINIAIVGLLNLKLKDGCSPDTYEYCDDSL